MDQEEFIENCLLEHNIYRLSHGVSALRHSIDLDKSAQERAEELITKETIDNSPVSSRDGVGENVSSGDRERPSGADIAKEWYGHIRNYDFVASSGSAGNFTQLIWKSSEEIGFGIAQSNDKYVVVAHYKPQGNVRGNYKTNVLPPDNSDVIFKNLGINEVRVAVSCGECCYLKKNKKCTEHNIQQEVWKDELCAYIGPSIHPRTDSMSSDENFELDLHTLTDFQKAQMRQLRQFIRDTISAINKYRILHSVPKLKHNKALDTLSQAWANKLSSKTVLSNSNYIYNGCKVGESVVNRSSTGKCDYTANEVADHWYAEHKKYNFYQEPSNIQGIGNFSQMLWKSTTDIGVGKVVLMKDKECRIIVVCNYYPAGNVLNKFLDNILQLKE